MSKSKRGRKKHERLLDVTLVRDKRVVVTTDSRNWVVRIGPATSRNFMAKADPRFFSSVQSMLRYLFREHLRIGISEIDFNDILRAVKEAEARIQKLGIDLDQKLRG